jgi:hypothetical protein
MADKKLVGENYSTPELRAKVTGRSSYAEDFRAEGMLFTRLVLSPYAHADQEHRRERRAGHARRESHSDAGRCARAQRSDQRQRNGDQGQSSQRNGARQRSDVSGSAGARRVRCE